MQHEIREEHWKTYVADTNGAILINLKALGGDKNPQIKLYSETFRKPSKTDNMSAKEIMAYIAGKL